MHLYFFGIIFNIFGYMLEDNAERSFLDGHSFSSFMVVMSYALTGLTVSLIMKWVTRRFSAKSRRNFAEN